MGSFDPIEFSTNRNGSGIKSKYMQQPYRVLRPSRAERAMHPLPVITQKRGIQISAQFGTFGIP